MLLVTKTAKLANYGLRGDLKPGDTCLLQKAKQKNMLKQTSTVKVTEKGQQLFIDTSPGPYSKSIANNKYSWVLIIDDYTRKAWSHFL
jgi:hypothetical protein